MFCSKKESIIDVLNKAEGTSPKLVLPEHAQKRLMLEHETTYNDLHRKFFLRKNKNAAFLKKMKNELEVFKQKIIYDIGKFAFTSFLDVELMKEFVLGIEDFITYKIESSDYADNHQKKHPKILLLKSISNFVVPRNIALINASQCA